MNVLHQTICASIRADIAEGRFQAGDRLPSLPQLQKRFLCSYGPVREAMLLLRHEGLVVTVPGKGIYVAVKPS